MNAAWSRRLTRWAPHKEGGQQFSLTHLHPLRYKYELPAMARDGARLARSSREIEIRVGFSNHTFTRKQMEGDQPEQRYTQSAEGRTFCRERYALSRTLLPTIVRTLDERDCYYANRENFLVVQVPPGELSRREYRVFFDARAQTDRGAVLLFVQSAYPSDGAFQPHGRGRKKIGFNAIVGKALADRTL